MGCGSSSGAVAGPIDTLAALATASGASEAELLSLSEHDLTELLHEQSVGVLARNRIVEEARRKSGGAAAAADAVVVPATAADAVVVPATALEASAPPAAKVEAVSSAEAAAPAVAANLRPAPQGGDKKVIVMSCPELGTLSPHGEGPYTEKVMDKVEELQQLGRVFFGFDRAGTTTQHPEDKALDWKNPEQIRKSKWMYGYKTAAKAQIKAFTQGFDGVLVIVCVNGGLVTRVEGEEMGRLVNDAKQDAEKSHLKVRIKLEMMDYCDFLEQYDGDATHAAE